MSLSPATCSQKLQPRGRFSGIGDISYSVVICDPRLAATKPQPGRISWNLNKMGGKSILEKVLKNKNYIFLLFSNTREGFNRVQLCVYVLLYCTKESSGNESYISLNVLSQHQKQLGNTMHLLKWDKQCFSEFWMLLSLKNMLPFKIWTCVRLPSFWAHLLMDQCLKINDHCQTYLLLR